MAAEFSLGFKNKIQVKNGYLIIGKNRVIVRLTDIASFNMTKQGLVLNGKNGPLATISKLPEKKAFALMDFINAEKEKSKPVASKPESRKSPARILLLLALLIVLLAAGLYVAAIFTVKP